MRLDERHGLPPLPRVELCLHAASGSPPAALTHLRQAVMEQARTHLGQAGQHEKKGDTLRRGRALPGDAMPA
jgi:hypothetical protein